MTQEGLNKIQLQIYGFIRTTFLSKGRTPSRAEIKRAIYRSSTNGLERDLGALQKAGFIELREGKKREHYNIRLLGMGLRLEGHIAAGRPIEKDNVPGQRIKLGLEFEDERNYVLIVKGTSMIEGGINDGDHIVIRHQETCNYGQIIVASHKVEPFEATLKKFRPDGEWVYLYPANSDMEPSRISQVDWERDWLIQGIVVISFHLFDRGLLEPMGWGE
jgi:repressor LexA